MAACLVPAIGRGGAGEAPPPPGAGEKPEAPIVREIEVRGNLRIDTGTVLRMIRTRVGRPFDRKTWDDDWHRLTDSGFFLNVRTAGPIPWPGGVKMVIELIELATIRRIKFKGNKSISVTDLLAAIQSTTGGRYQRGRVHLDARAIEKAYQDKAFRDVKVTYEVSNVSTHRQLVTGEWQDVVDEVVVTFIVDEGHPVSVRKLHFVGNQAFSPRQLGAVIQTRPRRLLRPGDLVDTTLDMDKKRLEQFYLSHGYMDVVIEKVDLKLSKKTYWNWFRKRKRLAEVTFHIKEGPQYRVGKVVLSGNQSLKLDEVKAVMRIKPGAVYSDLILSKDRDRIVKLYGEFGRVFTRVAMNRKLVTDPERIKKNPNLFDVELKIHEGAEVTVREVITRGNTKTKDKVLIRAIPLFPGDRVDTARIEDAKIQLKRLNYFEDDIRIETERTENPEEADLIVDVVEKPTGEFNFGLGVSSVDSLLGNVSLAQRNFDYKDLPKSWRDFISGNAFTGAGQSFRINATAGTRRQNYTVSFFEPWAFDHPIRLGFTLFRSVDNVFRDFNQTSTGLSLVAGKRLWGPRWDGDLTYRLNFNEIGDTSETLPRIFQRQEGPRFLSSLTPRIVYDSRDSRILPTRGYFAEASLQIGGGPFLGSLDWIKPSIDVARYFTVLKRPNGAKHVLTLRATASLIEAYGSTDDVLPFQRFFAGGIGTIRGFETRTIAPIENGFLIGGKNFFSGTIEYSAPLYQEIVRGSIFADAGQVSDAGHTDRGAKVTNRSGLRASVGFGLSIRTPLSPLPFRIFFSRAIAKNGEDRTKTVDFTFGTRF